MAYWSVPPQWYGERCFIFGCGPSLVDAPVSRLCRLGRTIAINDAYLRAPHSDILYFCDLHWWRANEWQIRNAFFGHWIVSLENELPGVKRLHNTGPIGLETDPCGLRHGSNSGYQAINLAYHLGAKEIVLVGFDMRTIDGRVHWRQRNGDNENGQTRTMTNVMLPKFQTLKTPLEQEGVRVINATPGSSLTIWPIVHPETFLG